MKAKATGDSNIPSAAECYASRLDEKSPTLTFTESDLSLDVSIFDHGKMALPSLFEDLTKEYLYLPQGRNEVLIKYLQ